MNNRMWIILGLTVLLGGISTDGLANPPVKPAPDNSKVNARDQKPHELTADNQGTSQSDVELTQKIRKDITSNHELSTYAHNVKIISQNGVVTLKGPVGSQSELKSVQEIAQRFAGRQNVKNEMQVANGR